MDESNVFHVHKAHIAYQNHVVLDIPDLTIPKGVRCAIIGPNGAGKSTLLKVLLGQHSQNVLCMGSPLKSWVERGKIAWVGQHEQFTLVMTVFEYVLLGRYPNRSWFARVSEEDRAEAMKWLEYFGLETMAKKRLNQLSGGERQRCAIVRAFLQNTDILLLDEPNNHLDIRHQHQLMQALAKHPKGNDLSCVMVLHDLSLAANYANYFVLMAHGKVIKQGGAKDVLTQEALQQAYGWAIRPLTLPSGAWGFDSFMAS